MDLTCVTVQTTILPKTLGKKSVLTVQTKVIVGFGHELTWPLVLPPSKLLIKLSLCENFCLRENFLAFYTF